MMENSSPKKSKDDMKENLSEIPVKKPRKKRAAASIPDKEPASIASNHDKLMIAANNILNGMTKVQLAQYQRLKEKLNIEEQIHSMLSEYLSGYVLVGYNAFNGSRVIIDFAETEALSDAVVELLKVTTMKIVTSGSLED